MVAPYNTGSLVRSLVRVPGSGSNRHATAVPLDLSKVSSLAAMVRVPQVLPNALQRTSSARAKTQEQESGQLPINAMKSQKLVPNSIQTTYKETSKVETETRQLKRPFSQDDREESRSMTTPAPKTRKIDNQVKTHVAIVEKQNPPSESNTTRGQQQLQTFISSTSQTTQQTQYIMLPVVSALATPTSQLSQMSSLQEPVVLTQHSQHQINTSATVSVPPPQNGMRQIGNLQTVRIVPVSSVETLQHQECEMPRVAVPKSVQDYQTAHTPQMFTVSAEVLQEMAQLKKENERLSQRLNKYQSIFKSRESLQLLARRLAETPA